MRWLASPSAARHGVDYSILRRPAGTGDLPEIARIGPLGEVDVTFVDVPPSGTYEYAIRTLASTFSSALTPIVTVATSP